MRLNVITRLDALSQVLGVEVLSQSLLPAIANLAVDSKWRVRLAIIEHIPLLLNQMSVAFFGDKLTDMCLTWLSDSVFSVRSAAVGNLRHLHTRLGEGWTITHVFPRIEQLCSHRNYLFRLTGLQVIQTLCPHRAQSLVDKALLPKALHLVKDTVPNVRMTCAKVLGASAKLIPATSPQRKLIVEGLNELCSDKDRDVKFAAIQV